MTCPETLATTGNREGMPSSPPALFGEGRVVVSPESVTSGSRSLTKVVPTLTHCLSLTSNVAPGGIGYSSKYDSVLLTLTTKFSPSL